MLVTERVETGGRLRFLSIRCRLGSVRGAFSSVLPASGDGIPSFCVLVKRCLSACRGGSGGVIETYVARLQLFAEGGDLPMALLAGSFYVGFLRCLESRLQNGAPVKCFGGFEVYVGGYVRGGLVASGPASNVHLVRFSRMAGTVLDLGRVRGLTVAPYPGGRMGETFLFSYCYKLH